MVTHTLRFVLVLALLLQGNFWPLNSDDPDRPYHFYLPLISQPGPCQVVAQDPRDGALREKGSYFPTHWILRNTGESAWLADRSTIRFVSGDRVHTGDDVMGLPYDVELGNMLDLYISMLAPYSVGTYSSNWAIADESGILCHFYIQFKVP